MKKVVVFGIGNKYHKYEKKLHEMFDIVAMIDNDANKCTPRAGGGVQPLSYIKYIDYDLIIITPSEFEEMYAQLLSLGVAKNKISLLSGMPELNCNKILGYHYWGQYGEDLIIANIFARIGIDKPSYMDLGANLPTFGSNTCFLYESGCRGINIDANPKIIKLFNVLRPEDININIGIAAKNSEKNYFIFDTLSGRNTFSPIAAKQFGAPIKKTIKLKVITLKELVDKYCPNNFPDFLDCDIEGLDYEVLQSYDLKSNGPKVILVEVGGNDIEKFDEMLGDKGYFRFCRAGVNNVYVKKEYGIMISLL